MNGYLARVVVLFFLLICVAWELFASPGFVTAAALVPALGWGLLLFAWLHHEDRSESARCALVALLFGAVIAAWPASFFSQILYDYLEEVTIDGLEHLVPTLLAPAVEESCKLVTLALVLRFVGAGLRFDRSVMVLGGFVGLGFAVTENLQYFLLAAIQDGTSGVWRALYLRGLLGGFHHALFTGTAAMGLVASRRRSHHAWLAISAFLVAAIVQHILWNRISAGMITTLICGVDRSGVPCVPMPDPFVFYFLSPLIAVATLLPGAVLIVVVGRRTAEFIARTPATSDPR